LLDKAIALEATVAEHGEPPSAGGGPAIIPAIVPAPLPLPEAPLLLPPLLDPELPLLDPELPLLDPELPLLDPPPLLLVLEPLAVASSPNPPLLPDVPGPANGWSPVLSGFDPHAAVTATAPAAIHNTCFVSDMDEPPAAWGYRAPTSLHGRRGGCGTAQQSEARSQRWPSPRTNRVWAEAPNPGRPWRKCRASPAGCRRRADATRSPGEVIMDPFVERLIDAYQGRTLEAFDTLLTDDVVLVRDDEKAHGREAFKAVLSRLRRAFPDIRYQVEDVVRVGDRIVLRWEARGTHQGEYLGVQGTGRPISYRGITLYEMRDDRIARVWVSADLLSLLRRMSGERKLTAEATA
jgi:steroid delta-isomerase-like uncharacterized protein